MYIIWNMAKTKCIKSY